MSDRSAGAKYTLQGAKGLQFSLHTASYAFSLLVMSPCPSTARAVALSSLSFLSVLIFSFGASIDNPPRPDDSAWPDGGPQNPLILAVQMQTEDTVGIGSRFRAEKLFKDGQIVGKWAHCQSDTNNTDDCPVVPSYIDRMSMSYRIDNKESLSYVHGEPEVQSFRFGAGRVPGVSTPTVADFDFDSSIGHFTVLYGCPPGAKNFTELLELKVPLLSNYSVILHWMKQCTSGPHPFLEIGQIVGDKHEPFRLRSAATDVDPMTVSSSLYLRVKPPAVAQMYSSPSVNSSNKAVGVTLRGITAGGVVSTKADLQFAVIYTCHASGEATIEVSLSVTPWNDVVAKLVKSCGGPDVVPRTIEIGTGPNKKDVVTDGKVTPRYQEDAGVFMPIAIVPVTESQMQLYIRNADMNWSAVVHFGKAHITVGNPRIATVRSQGYLSASSEQLRPGESKRLQLHILCLMAGKTRVVITVPALQYKTIDVAFEKECKKPEVHSESGWHNLRTVEGIEDAFLLLCVVAFASGVFVYFRMRRGYEAVPLETT